MPTVNKNILQLINGEFYSGAERVQDLLAQNLISFGYSPWIACLKPNVFVKYCQFNKNRIFDFQMNSRFDIKQAYYIARFIKEKKFRIIHSHTPRTLLIAYIATLIEPIPIIHHQHSPTSIDTENRIRNLLNAYLESFLLKKAHHVIVVSNSLKNYVIKKGVKKEQCSVVLNGVPRLKKIPYRIPPKDQYVIGMIALFRPRKGLETLLQALSILKNKGTIVQLRAIGAFEKKEYKMTIQSLAKTLCVDDLIDWVGFVDDIYSEFRNLDIMVLPSLYGEGLPMVILESMANGVPVIASCVEGLLDAIPSDDFGYLFEPGDSEQLANKILTLLTSSDLWEETRINAFNRQSTHLSDLSMSSSVAGIYDKTLQ